ncbi:DUF2892 domain-containing protein [Jannaschia sp. 2305UL9-9]|uniref:YgaP family membrane protein n=1 Tax=Jannaschia sp. 2305UL9-9 TaxID=3121638 RepID=UPI0035273D1C
MGLIDRGLRFVLGAALIIATLMGAIGIWGWVGLIPLATAFIGFCPLYRIIGVKTCSDC